MQVNDHPSPDALSLSQAIIVQMVYSCVALGQEEIYTTHNNLELYWAQYKYNTSSDIPLPPT